MIYDIRLSIAHSYAQPSGIGRHLIRVAPRALPDRQRLLAQLVQVSPPPDERYDRRDFFGNAVTGIAHFSAHAQMEVSLSARVEVTAPEPLIDLAPGLGNMAGELAGTGLLEPDAPLHFLGTSPRLGHDDAIAAFARDVTEPDQPTTRAVLALGQAVHRAIAFDATATTVDTDPSDAFRTGRGVCQDMSHIMIVGLRALGVPAGYVSGYLRTLPPPGSARLEGADAMHAWVRAWCGRAQGWVEFDPTNNCLVGTDHIVAGFGRDYTDVSPLIGTLRGSGKQSSVQAVDVIVAG